MYHKATTITNNKNYNNEKGIICISRIAIDLSDENNDGLVFMIEGTIKDNDSTGSCSGLLVLDKNIHRNKPDDNKWNMSFYLYDNGHEDCEIAFRLPVYSSNNNNNVLN